MQSKFIAIITVIFVSFISFTGGYLYAHSTVANDKTTVTVANQQPATSAEKKIAQTPTPLQPTPTPTPINSTPIPTSPPEDEINNLWRELQENQTLETGKELLSKLHFKAMHLIATEQYDEFCKLLTCAFELQNEVDRVAESNASTDIFGFFYVSTVSKWCHNNGDALIKCLLSPNLSMERKQDMLLFLEDAVKYSHPENFQGCDKNFQLKMPEPEN